MKLIADGEVENNFEGENILNYEEYEKFGRIVDQNPVLLQRKHTFYHTVVQSGKLYTKFMQQPTL